MDSIDVQNNLNIKDNDILKHDNSFNSQFIRTGQRPQNFIKNVDPSCRYVKYPKTAQLMHEKNQWISKRNHPPVFLKVNLQQFALQQLGHFDVIYCDPPWEEYELRAKRLGIYNKNMQYYKSWTVEKISRLSINEISDNPSFLFLWAGSQHLQDARQLFKKWGYKRCQDIVWAKTNLTRKKIPVQSQEGIFIRVKQHCLMGYKGDSKKVSDHNFVHPNIDIDVIITQEPQLGSLEKPSEIYDIIERFCLGRKKIELFGQNSNIRNGWLTIGSMLSQTKFEQQEYQSWFKNTEIVKDFIGRRMMGTTSSIESLRPRQEFNQLNVISLKNIHEQQGKKSTTKSDTSKY